VGGHQISFQTAGFRASRSVPFAKSVYLERKKVVQNLKIKSPEELDDKIIRAKRAVLEARNAVEAHRATSSG
jgi:hypothetical protein